MIYYIKTPMLQRSRKQETYASFEVFVLDLKKDERLLLKGKVIIFCKKYGCYFMEELCKEVEQPLQSAGASLLD